MLALGFSQQTQSFLKSFTATVTFSRLSAPFDNVKDLEQLNFFTSYVFLLSSKCEQM